MINNKSLYDSLEMYYSKKGIIKRYKYSFINDSYYNLRERLVTTKCNGSYLDNSKKCSARYNIAVNCIIKQNRCVNSLSKSNQE